MNTAMTAVLDPTRAEAFAGRMLQILNDASLASMAAIGHRTGLFDALSGGQPATRMATTPSARSSTGSRASTA